MEKILTLQEHNKLKQKLLNQSLPKPEFNWTEIYRNELKLIYLYERLLGQRVDASTSSARLDWFKWCIQNKADPEISMKDKNE